MNILLKLLIKQHKVISFDIFDTLIERDVSLPTDIFEIVGEEMLGRESAEKFKKDRIQAEKKARALRISGEVNLEEIYEVLSEQYHEKSDLLKQEEIKQERKHCVKKQVMIPYLEYAKAQGKTIYLISDMYLPKPIIDELLRQCGITGYRKCYVSNEKRANKRSGKLFTTVLQEENIRRRNMLHIGDGIRPDLLGALRCGIMPVLIRQKNRYLRKIGKFCK